MFYDMQRECVSALHLIRLGVKDEGGGGGGGYFSSEKTMEEAQRIQFYDLDDNTGLFA